MSTIDTVTISASTLASINADSYTIQEAEQAKKDENSIKVTKSSDEDSSEISDEARIKYIQQQMKKIQQEIQEVQEDETLSEDQKQEKIQILNQELMSLSQELMELMGGTGVIGGTAAQGMANSLT